MKAGRTLQELAVEIQRQSGQMHDLIVSTDVMHMGITDKGLATLNIGENNTFEVYDINDIAHRQIGSYTRIPAPYYERMRRENPELLAYNVNSWLETQEPQNRMIRTLDGTARALLSDRYRRIDNYEVAEAVLPAIAKIGGARVESAEITAERMYIKVVSPRLEAEVRVGDVVQAGMVITNSEVGLGSVNIRPMIYRLVCTNGMIAPDAMGRGTRQNHIGRQVYGGEDYSVYRTETMDLDAQVLKMKLQDTVASTMNKFNFNTIVGEMREATSAKLDPRKADKIVELTAKQYGLIEEERTGVLGYLISGGDLSVYGLANAVTREAQDVESYDRSTELETKGYQILTMSKAFYNQLQNA